MRRTPRSAKMPAVFMILIVAVAVIATIGWVRNAVSFAKCDFKAPYRAEALRAIGVVPPVGAIMGWIDIKDGPEPAEAKP